MSKEELLSVWRGNLDRINLQIAQRGGDTVAPLDLINLRDQTRREIEGLQADPDESGTGWLAQASIIAWFRTDYARDMATLRGELSSWQARLMQDLDDMVDQKIGPSEKAVDALTAKLDTIAATVQAMSVQVALVARDMETVRGQLTALSQAQRDIDRLKGHVGLNGDARPLSSHMAYVIVLLTAFVMVVGGSILWSTLH